MADMREPPPLVTGAEAFLQTLESMGAKYLFGLGGGPVADIQDALLDHPNLQYIMGLHEGPLVAMADGYARASGGPAFVTIQTTGGPTMPLHPSTMRPPMAPR